jgi:hypothetical protein
MYLATAFYPFLYTFISLKLLQLLCGEPSQLNSSSPDPFVILFTNSSAVYGGTLLTFQIITAALDSGDSVFSPIRGELFFSGQDGVVCINSFPMGIKTGIATIRIGMVEKRRIRPDFILPRGEVVSLSIMRLVVCHNNTRFRIKQQVPVCILR